jgi:hypothetical protein
MSFWNYCSHVKVLKHQIYEKIKVSNGLYALNRFWKIYFTLNNELSIEFFFLKVFFEVFFSQIRFNLFIEIN